MPLKISKLCANFDDMLKDTSPFSMLDYFIQYMDSIGAIHQVQFWLSVETFKVTCTPKSREGNNNKTSTGYDGGDINRHDFNDPMSFEGSAGGSPQLAGGCPQLAGGSSHDSHGSSRERRLLQRKDTENHMYCNCKVHMMSTPPQAVKKGGGSTMTTTTTAAVATTTITTTTTTTTMKPLAIGGVLQGSPRLTVTCEHRSPHLVTKHSSASPTVLNHTLPEKHCSPALLSLEDDAIGIYTKYLAFNAMNPVEVTDQIRQRVEVNICPEDDIILSSCFKEAEDYVYNIMLNRYFPRFLHSSFLCKYQLKYISSGKLNLTDFLLGENALFYFMEYMEQEGASYLLQFWLIAENFYNQLSSPSHTPDIEVDTADAMVIYDRYLSLQATEPLSMEDSVRMDVENRICDEHGPRTDSFLRPQSVAFHTMNEVHYAAFVESSVYLRFLNELIHMLNKEEESSQGNSMETSATNSHTNTNSQKSNLFELSLGRDLDDPHTLWKRPPLLFRLGYVTELGEYISEVELPVGIHVKKDKSNWSVTARALRKRKKEEELAMGIASNIIKEVTRNYDVS